jgi:hypothetical protein
MPAAAVAAVVAVIGVALLTGGSGGPVVTTSARMTLPSTARATSSGLFVPGTLTPDPTQSGPTMPPINVLLRPDQWQDARRPFPNQPLDWLKTKASGRVALVNGQFTILPAGANPLVNLSTGLAVPDKAILDTSWTRWIIEVPGSGIDEKGNSFSNLSYWEFCGNGAMTVVLWYWQQLTGHPNVTGTEGYFLDPYEAEGVAWPARGPEIAVRNGTRLGTYWSGSDTVSGFEAHGRGFEMYLAMAASPPTWQSTGYSLWALDGKPLYPSFGTPPNNVLAGLNWEVSGYDQSIWPTAYYSFVFPSDPTLARDLTEAVTIDVGRDGVPVLAMVDSFNLPNWQAGAETPHIGHSIAIVGYDNTANPPTFTYTETCGRACNRRGGNQNGDIHVIPQADLVKAIQNQKGLGFAW